MEEDIGAYYKKRAVILKTLLGQLQSAVFTLEALARETQMVRYASNRKAELSTIANNGNRKAVLMAH